MLPVVGCGTWLGFDIGARPLDLPSRRQVLEELFAAGGRVVDSSPMYGSAEAVVGDLLQDARSRDGAFVATKVWTTGRRAGIAQMEQSMERLRTPVIDLMQVHNLQDWNTHLPTMREWKAQGRLRYLGITHYTDAAHPELEKLLRSERLDFVQCNYSAEDTHAAQRLLPAARELGVAVLVNLPFGGGRLLRSLQGRPLPRWAGEIGCASWNEVLLKFVLSQPAVTCVIPGTSNPAHMRANARAGETEPPPLSFWKDKAAAFA